ncbi:MAG: general secretion pathway protein GspK [Candidatus Thiodiazotropha taylori]|nr:general secretion pathway protein GspK [Candidatus Thiodiazotropha taylori]MCW4231702.1 general secretion pathway protein GspK [Candidatus Thiodiazotropha taylori]
MRRRQRGLVLVLVLWALVLLLVIVSAVSSSVHTETTLAHHQLDQTRLRALADAAFHYGAARGYDPDAESAWLTDGVTYEWQFEDVEMEIRIVKERIRLDLNSATAQQLKSVMEALELDAEQTAQVIDAILDWRDRDSLHRLNGAEDEHYERAGMAYGAKDAPFTTVDEIGLILGIDAELKTSLLPYLSVGSVAGGTIASPLSIGFGKSSGLNLGRGLWVLVKVLREKQPFYAEALVRQSKDRLRLDKINYGVSSAAWPLDDE